MRKYEEALQVEAEINWLIDIFKREGVRSYLEIGSKWGGSLWRIANALPNGSQITVVDLPWGDRKTESSLISCCAELQDRGYKVHLITDDSTKRSVVHSVDRFATYDACFIDANHTEPYVRADWANYGPMARIVAFHDIAFHRDAPMPPHKMPIDVPKVWNEIKQGYRYEECKLDPTGNNNGIGVLWRS